MADRMEARSERKEYSSDDRGERAGGAVSDDDRGGRGGGRSFRRRKVCRFCSEKDAIIDYRDASGMKYFISERGKIVPRRISGNCAKHQREMAEAVKRARHIALIPFTITT